MCHTAEMVLSEAYGTCAQWLPHVGRTGTLFPAVKTWMASTHPLYVLWPALHKSDDLHAFTLYGYTTLVYPVAACGLHCEYESYML